MLLELERQVYPGEGILDFTLDAATPSSPAQSSWQDEFWGTRLYSSLLSNVGDTVIEGNGSPLPLSPATLVSDIISDASELT